MEKIEQGKIISMGVFGSHLYGLNTPDSDKDYKGIYIPNKRNFYLGDYPNQISKSTGGEGKNTREDKDVDIYSLQKFVKEACRGETFAIDMLHMENFYVDSYLEDGGFLWRVWMDLVENRTKFYSGNMKAFVGYARKQAAKYGIKGSRMDFIKKCLDILKENPSDFKIGEIFRLLPTGEFAEKINTGTFNGTEPGGRDRMDANWWIVCGKKFSGTTSVGLVEQSLQKMYDGYGYRAEQAKNNEGVDWKALSHAFRACFQLRDIFKYGDFEYPLTENTFLMKVKKGELDFKTEVQPELEDSISEVEELAKSYPAEVDVDYWNRWLYNVLEEYYK